jgi:nucleoside-diphosphate-sugar epimerase
VKILVTGASGFIGRVLCEQLAARNDSVRAAVRSQRANVSASETVVVGNIDGCTEWAAAVAGVDVVFHAAAVAHVTGRTAQQNVPYEEVNAVGTRRLANAAAAAGVRRFVYVSTAKVGGEFTRAAPYREDEIPRPVGQYAISKWHAEQGIGDIVQGTSMDFTIIRPPLVYGPGVRANFLALLQFIDRGLPLPLPIPQPHRSMIYVENLVDALIIAAHHPLASGHTFYVKDPHDLTLGELVKRLAALMRKRAMVLPFPASLLRLVATTLRRRDAAEKLTHSFVIDDTKIRGLLGWQPRFTNDDGLAATVAWYRQVAQSTRI